MINTGVALFDDPLIEKNTEGWYSIQGEKSMRFSRHSDLPSDCIFITNIDFSSLGKISIARHNLMLEAYLPTKMEDILADLGTSIQEIGIPMAVEVLSVVVSSTFNLTQQCYGEQVLSNFTLSKGIASNVLRPVMQDYPYIEDDALLQNALKDSYLRSTVCEFSKNAAWSSSKPVSHLIRLNRTLHAKSVLTRKIPKGQPKTISSVESIETILKSAKPVLIQVRVSNFKHDAAPIFAFGARSPAGAKGKTAPLRTWVTNHELETLHKLATVVPLGYPWLLWEDGWQEHGYHMPDLLCHPVIAASYSGQLLAESFLGAILGPQFENRRTYNTPLSVFLSAKERMDMFSLAYEVSQISGVTVTSFGPGRIKAQTRTNFNNDALLSWSKDHGFIFPCEYPFPATEPEFQP